MVPGILLPSPLRKWRGVLGRTDHFIRYIYLLYVYVYLGIGGFGFGFGDCRDTGREVVYVHKQLVASIYTACSIGWLFLGGGFGGWLLWVGLGFGLSFFFSGFLFFVDLLID